jgi:hypothetical protein
MRQTRLFLISLLVVTVSLPVQAGAEMGKAAVEKAIDAGFSELERQIIEKYFGGYPDEETEVEDEGKVKSKKKGLPPGLAKREKLPPGLERQLQRNGTLPPGLAKRELPADLDQQLPEPPEGFERTIVANAVILVEKATGRIADIIKDVVVGD